MVTIKRINDMDEKINYCYELWGNDTFSNETYPCGVYKHYSSARRAMKRHVANCLKTQSEGLRDTFWITRTTMEEHYAAARIRNSRIEKVHEQIRQDKEQVETIFPDLECFIKEGSQTVGRHTFPLPKSMNSTCIRKIEMIFKKAYKCRVRYSFEVVLNLVSPSGFNSEISITCAFGQYHEVVSKIVEASFFENLKGAINKEIFKNYCNDI